MKRRPQGNGGGREYRKNSNPVARNRGRFGPPKRVKPGHLFAPESGLSLPVMSRTDHDNLGPRQRHFAIKLFVPIFTQGHRPIKNLRFTPILLHSLTAHLPTTNTGQLWHHPVPWTQCQYSDSL